MTSIDTKIDSLFYPEEIFLIRTLFRDERVLFDSKNYDENRLLNCAAKNGLLQLLNINSVSKSFSYETQQELKNHYLFNLAKNAAFQTVAAEILQKLAEKGIPVVLLKGISLINNIYEDISLRPMSDLDFMVPTENFFDAWNILNAKSIQMKRNDYKTGHHLPGFNYKGINVELHRYLVPADVKYQIPIDEIWQNTIKLKENNALTLNPIHQAIYLLLHIYYTYRQGGIRLGWFFDIKELMTHFGDIITLEKIEKQAISWNIYVPIRKMLVFLTVLYPQNKLSIAFSKKDTTETLKMIKLFRNSDSLKSKYSYSVALERLWGTKGLKNKIIFLYNAFLDDGTGKRHFSIKRIGKLTKKIITFLANNLTIKQIDKSTISNSQFSTSNFHQIVQTKILVFIDWFLPGYKAGGPVRSVANLITHLYKDLQFYIVTRDTEYLEKIPYNNVVANQWNNFQHNVKIYYTSDKNLSLKLWRKLINEIKPNVVYINGIYSKYFSIYPILAAKKDKKAKIIVTPRGMLSTSAIGVKNHKKRTFLTFAKVFKLYKNIEWHATNNQERDDICKETASKGIIKVAPNLPRKTNLEFKTIEKLSKLLRLIVPARIAPEKNTLFALNCLKNTSGVNNIIVDLYGQIYDKEYWQKCKIIIAQMPKNISINYCGVVEPEKVVEKISEYHAILLPTRGENFGHIILEGFMAARPVIISNKTPWHNLQEKNAGWDLQLNEKIFSETIEKLADMQQTEYDILCKGAFNVSQEYINDNTLLENYYSLFR